MPRQKREATTYLNESIARGVKVLEALRGENFEPVKIRQVMERTGFSYDFCMRALKTFAVEGFAVETPQGWTLGTRLMKFSTNYNEVVINAMNIKNSDASEFSNRNAPIS